MLNNLPMSIAGESKNHYVLPTKMLLLSCCSVREGLFILARVISQIRGYFEIAASQHKIGIKRTDNFLIQFTDCLDSPDSVTAWLQEGCIRCIKADSRANILGFERRQPTISGFRYPTTCFRANGKNQPSRR
jgi:hypothetical protein